ncbi:MAG TPA: hypothetical protein VFE58_02490 [Tepidisphaeraceae bacterium]|nr:hypothetical protein [Tepidisphaeraceae bacterium]
MSTIEAYNTLSQFNAPMILTQAAGDESLASYPRPHHYAKWQSVIDQTLVEWGRNPLALEDDGVLPPSRKAIVYANKLALTFRDKGIPGPDRVVPIGDGGIAFELNTIKSNGESIFQSLEIDPDGVTTLTMFKNGTFMSRSRIL